MLKFYVISKTVAAGGQETDFFSPEVPIKVKKIYVNERSGAALNNVFLDMDIQGTKITKQPIPCSLLNVPWNQLPPIEFDLGKGVRLNFTIINNTGGSLNIDIVIAYEEG